MARNAPLHLQGVLLIDGRHIVDLPVARRAPDPFCDVDTVVEVNEFRQIVYAFPFDRFVIAEARSHGLKVRAVRPDLAMAVHAGLRRRHPRRGSRLDRGVAISTVNAVIPGVMLVTELHGLLFLEITAGEVRRPRYLRVNVKCSPGENNCDDHADACDVVCTLMKKLCHYYDSLNEVNDPLHLGFAHNPINKRLRGAQCELKY